MENFIILAITLIFSVVAIYHFKQVIVKESEEYTSSVSVKITPEDNTEVKIGQVWTKDISLQDTVDPFYEPIHYDIEVIDIKTNSVDTYVQYRPLGGTRLSSTSLKRFLENATLKP